jgi:predicted nucleic acid-binding protein
MRITVASAKARPYVDPSALLRLYIHEPESAAMNAWRKRNPQVLTMTHHGRAELTNAIGLALFRKLITSDAYADTLASFEEDCAEGGYVHTDVLWRATLKRATDLSREHTPRIGCRSLDVLHVASALELEFKRFLTFDLCQQKLARAVALKVKVPEA